jgi:sulfonate transport system ATP-binding protein
VTASLNGIAPRRDTGRGEVVVRAVDVARRFGDRVVLDGVSIDLVRGEVVAMIGRSGAGKSTFLRVLGGFETEATGELWLPPRRANVFQSPRLMPWKRVLPNVVFGLSGPGLRERGRRALAEVGLASHERAWPGTLSGGEAQRVALARAFVREPDLLLLDEPFGALDALTRLKMHELVAALLVSHCPATVLVTHDVDEAISLSDRVVLLDNGRIARDIAVDVPRRRDSAAFLALRTRLLRALGVDTTIG